MDATVFTPDGMEPDAKAVEQLATRAPHGAGRVMSRTKAAGKWKEGRGRAYAAGRLDRHQGRSACAPLGVLTAHPNIEIVHRLRPLGVFMAGGRHRRPVQGLTRRREDPRPRSSTNLT